VPVAKKPIKSQKAAKKTASKSAVKRR
jgi:hypothetical protein